MFLQLLQDLNFTTLSLVILTIASLIYLLQRKTNLPPGPTPLPLIGNYLTTRGKLTLHVLRKLRKQYGDIFYVKVGPQPFIVLNGYDTLREAFVKRADEFSDRPDLPFVRAAKGLGIVNSSGPIWKHTRSFSLAALRDFGFGKKSLESKIMEEVEVFLEIVESSNGRPMTINKVIYTCVSNVICNIVFGERFAHDDKRFLGMIEQIKRNFREAGGGLVNNSPLVVLLNKMLPGDVFGVQARNKRFSIIRETLYEEIVKHGETLDSNTIRDFIDHFLIEQGKHQKENPVVFSDDNLNSIITNLFIGGTETTSTTMCWFVLYLLHNRDIQVKMRNEIEQVVGSSRYPSINDRPEMPYCEAVMIETLRCGNIVPNSIPHGASRDIQFRGFTFPKGSVLLMSLDSVMRDPDLFENPEKFNPSRFIDADGKLVGHEKVIAFSIGRRVCLGERLARMEFFLFLTSLVQRFNLVPLDENNLPTLDSIVGAVNSSTPYCFKALKI